MTSPTLYGIKNCDTMKKALKWLESNNISYEFHDYKKQGIDNDVLTAALKQHSWENVINRRGTTWRKLPENVRENMDANQAIEIAIDNPSILRRPLLVYNKNIHLGFKEDIYKDIFK